MEGNQVGTSLEEARSRAVDLLSDLFARDALSLEKFEVLIGRVHKANTLAELDAVTDRFRRGTTGGPESPRTAASRLDARSAARTADSAHPRSLASDSAIERHRDSAVAVFGEIKRAGHWIPARETTVVAALGSVEIDLRDATLAPGEFVFDVYAVLGSVEVIAPRGLRVECGGSAILGSIDPGRPEPPAPGPAGPLVRLNCVSILGEVEVDFRLRGETKRQSKRRRKIEDRERRRLASGKSRNRRTLSQFFDG